MTRMRAMVTLLALYLVAACGAQPADPTATVQAGPTASPQAASPEPTLVPVEDTPTPIPTRGSRSYLPYRNEANGFSLQYPEEWELSENETMPGTATFVAPLRSEDDTFRENVTVVVQSLPAGSTTLDDYTEMALDQGQEYIPQFTVHESRPATLSDSPAQQVIYTGFQGERLLRWLQIWTLSGDRVYILTYTAEDLEFNAFRSVVQQMIRTMEIR